MFRSGGRRMNLVILWLFMPVSAWTKPGCPSHSGVFMEGEQESLAPLHLTSFMSLCVSSLLPLSQVQDRRLTPADGNQTGTWKGSSSSLREKYSKSDTGTSVVEKCWLTKTKWKSKRSACGRVSQDNEFISSKHAIVPLLEEKVPICIASEKTKIIIPYS